MSIDNNEKTEKKNEELLVEPSADFVIYTLDDGKSDTEEARFDIKARRAELIKKVDALTMMNVEPSFSEDDVVKAAFPDSLKADDEKERIKFERKCELRAYNRAAILLNEALAAEKKRENCERQLAILESKLDKEREGLAQQFEQDKAVVQQKIDALKQQMYEFGKSVQEKELANSEDTVDKSNKEQWFKLVLRNKKQLPEEKNEVLTNMLDKMQEYNSEMEDLQMAFNQKVAANLAEFDKAKAQVTLAKQEENFHKQVVKTWVANQEEKKQVIRQAVSDGVKEIVELDEKEEAHKLTRRQRVIAALRQIYHYLCKKFSGLKRDKVAHIGKQAIEKEKKKEFADIIVDEPASMGNVARA